MPRAVFVSRHGGPEVLELREHDPGAPGPGEVRIRVEAAGVNFIDTYLRSGVYARPVPFIAGLEGAGLVEQAAPDVTDLPVGTRVAWAQVAGSYSTHVNAAADAVVRVPDGVSAENAAACMLQGMTAHYLVHGVRRTQPGDIALVHASAGATGQLLVQMLKRSGAFVIGTCSSEEKEKLSREAGADVVIRYTERDFVEETKRATSGRGADVVYDSVGLSTFDGSLRSLRPRGLCVLFGQASGPVPPLDLQRLNQGGSLFVTRPSLGHYVATRAELEERANAVLGAVRSGDLRLRIQHLWQLKDAAAAHAALEGRATTGKILLATG